MRDVNRRVHEKVPLRVAKRVVVMVAAAAAIALLLILALGGPS